MIVQDSLTGALHQVPDQFAEYGGYADYGDLVYDGYGNPVGRLAGVADEFAGPFGLVPRRHPRPPQLRPGAPLGKAPGMPPGWEHPSSPYAGRGPKRVYMRCAVWPGPRGLVPASAKHAPPAAAPVGPHHHRHPHHRRR